MLSSYPFLSALVIFLLVYGGIYTWFYIFFSRRVKYEEGVVLDIFLRKISKVPALIEVMRPYVAKKEAFQEIIQVHTEMMISASDSLYDVLSHNARLQNEFLFLMKLSVHVPELQKHEYFVYIRDFIIEYERTMRKWFSTMNEAIRLWNHFVTIKNMTGIGFFLPGMIRPEII